VINLIFDFDISLFMSNMWITIISYFDFGHVSIESQCHGIHAYMSLLSLLVWMNKVVIRTGRWWMYRLQSGNTEGSGIFLFFFLSEYYRVVPAHRNWLIETAHWNWASFFTEGLETRWQRFGQFVNDLQKLLQHEMS